MVTCTLLFCDKTDEIPLGQPSLCQTIFVYVFLGDCYILICVNTLCLSDNLNSLHPSIVSFCMVLVT